MASTAYQLTRMACLKVLETNLVPDIVVRVVVRLLIARRVAKLGKRNQAQINKLEHEVTARINHRDRDRWPSQLPCWGCCELPAEYYHLVLGKQFKQNCCLFPDAELTLNDAEDSMLELTCQRAQLTDCQHILELGCGWGSLSLYIAAKYPHCQLTAVCNSMSHKIHINRRCRQRGLANVQVTIADVADFQTSVQYDRVLLIESLGDPQTYRARLYSFAGWLKPHGRLFIQAICNQHCLCTFQETAIDSWIFPDMPGNMLPSLNLLTCCQDDLTLEKHWYVNGQNYSRTLEAWMRKERHHRKAIQFILQESLGQVQSHKVYLRHRLACLIKSELFSYAGGTEWGIGQYLFEKI